MAVGRRRIDWNPVDARLARALEHVADLEATVGRFASLPPYRHDMSVTEAGTWVERVDSIQPAPIELSMIASDAIHQARAALDNAIGVIRPAGPTASSAFPIRSDRAEYDKIEGPALAGLPDWAVDIIRRMQPFSNDHGAYVGEELVDLHDMARIDRHRAPAVQIALLQPDYVEGRTVEMRGDWQTWAEVEYRPGEVERVHFKVRVEFADGPLERFDVAEGTSGLVRVAWAVVEQLKLAEQRA
jgi:hypothetical protein